MIRILSKEVKEYKAATPLAPAILCIAAFYGVGILSTYVYNRIMVIVTQGVLSKPGAHEQLLEQRGRYNQLYTGNAIGV